MGANTKSTTVRRASSSLSKVATPPAAVRSGKGSKPSLIVKLNVSSTILSRFPHEKPTRKAPLPKSTTAPPPLPPPPPPAAPAPNEKAKVVPVKSESKPSPSPPQPESPETSSDKVTSKGTAGPKTGTKRELGEGVDDSAKSKARPGPKKRQKQ